MTTVGSVLSDYRDAVRSFSRPARLFLLATLFTWTGHGIAQVLFNLYLLEGGFREAFIGRAISLNGLGLALAALPAGLLADRWGHKRALILGALLEGAGMILRSTVLTAEVITAATFCAGAGQALLAIAAAPLLSEHSTTRERTHLFSTFFAVELLAAVAGSMMGGMLPEVLARLPAGLRPDALRGYRWVLVLGALLATVSIVPLMRIASSVDHPKPPERRTTRPEARRVLVAVAVNAALIGAGAGLVIPFMNLYFATRFQCSSAQIGVFFSLAQVSTAIAAMMGPIFARRFGKLRTAVAAELLSLPFLVTLGAEHRLSVAVGAFWIRATLMQASAPLIQAFIMEALPPALRGRSTSLNNLVWNAGWAASATLSGWLIQRFGYAVPFYVTASLYATAALFFYFSFRGTPEGEPALVLSEEAKGQRGEGPFTE